MDEALKDERFKHMCSDPLLKNIPKCSQKVVLDKKTKVFKDKSLKGIKLDKRGRPLNLTPTENVERSYDMSSKSSEEPEDEKDTRGNQDLQSNKLQKKGNKSEKKEENKEVIPPDETQSYIDEELRNEAPHTNEITRRLAVCNMDWDKIRAVDLLVCFNSFKPADGKINSVKIYPSEYGLKCMEEENLKGPYKLVEKALDEVEDKCLKHHRGKFRPYQINRLKYFYAVVDCDSPETANVLHEELNGIEYESSGVRLDLRIIPDDVIFDQEPTSIAEKLPDFSKYEPSHFVTSALQHVNVNLTWDETDPERREFFRKIRKDSDSVQNEIPNYLASPSSEEENLDDEEPNKSMKIQDRITQYRELLQSIEEKEKEKMAQPKYDIEVTWEPAIKRKVKEQVREKIQKENLNPFEEMLQKKKDKKLTKKLRMNKKDDDSLSSSSEELDSKKSNRKAKDKLAELALISDSKKEMDVDEKPNKKKKEKDR